MNVKDLVQIFDYIQKQYPNEDLYITCRGCWDWFIGSNTSYNVRFSWDSNDIATFEDFLRNIKEINLNEEN